MKHTQQPKYIQLKREILAWLQTGRLQPNDQMPSEHEIAGRFGISRQTVRHTLGELVQEGRLYRIQGKGTFVSPAKSGGSQGGQTIAMLTTYISDYIFPHIVRGAELSLRQKGYSLLLSSTDNDKEKELVHLQTILDQPPRGLIIEPTKSALGNPNLPYFLALRAQGIPFVMINERYPEMNCPCVKVDDASGGFKATEHLIQLGHKRIAGFFKTDDLQGVNRLKGFLLALEQYHVALRPEFVVSYSTEEKNTKPFAAALDMLKRKDRPTAFVCYNDELAVKLLDAIRLVGLTVPRQLSITGFDDSSLATASEIKLTTLTHPKADLGAKATEMLLDMIAGRPDGQPQDFVYAPELVIRESTCAWP
ncbi:MAG TPA: GntR family transcriptional regulator [Bacilli bacterium]